MNIGDSGKKKPLKLKKF